MHASLDLADSRAIKHAICQPSSQPLCVSADVLDRRGKGQTCRHSPPNSKRVIPDSASSVNHSGVMVMRSAAAGVVCCSCTWVNSARRQTPNVRFSNRLCRATKPDRPFRCGAYSPGMKDATTVRVTCWGTSCHAFMSMLGSHLGEGCQRGAAAGAGRLLHCRCLLRDRHGQRGLVVECRQLRRRLRTRSGRGPSAAVG